MRLLPSGKSSLLVITGLVMALLVYKFAISAGPSNGFDLSNSTLPVEQILHGGPPRDGIPALSDPKLIKAALATYLQPTDRIGGVELHREARAYPINMLTNPTREIINDKLGGRSIAATW